jgi:hypothetical protein
MGPIGCTETSVKSCRRVPRNIPQERVPLHVLSDATVSKGKGEGKVKVHPITGHEGPEVE